jgi:hypothetical protein
MCFCKGTSLREYVSLLNLYAEGHTRLFKTTQLEERDQASARYLDLCSLHQNQKGFGNLECQYTSMMPAIYKE